MSEAMKKDVQETFERALAGFEKRQEAEQQRLREREKFEAEWTRIRTAVTSGSSARGDQSAIEGKAGGGSARFCADRGSRYSLHDLSGKM